VTAVEEQPGSTRDKLAIASEIIRGREQLGLTQAQLSAQSQVSLSAIKGYETGRNLPGAKEIRQICQVLRISPNRLVFGVENPFPESSWPHEPLPEKGKPIYTPPEPGQLEQRLQHLLPLLSSSERQAIHSIVYSLATARHGAKVVSGQIRSADLESGAELFIESGRFVPSLHAKLLVNPSVARNYASAIVVAAIETEKMIAEVNAVVESSGGIDSDEKKTE
jgi:transcriptional regulator with XRE-family HTH domain